jgi:NADH:ubiquinone oxidoreductase subunit 6 (subunit J)
VTALDIFALIILITIGATALLIFVVLGMLPGKVAKQRSHPQHEAINIGSWIALVAGGVLWPLILIWSYTKVPTSQEEGANT